MADEHMRLADLLGETRGEGFAEFIADVDAALSTASDDVRPVLLFARAVGVALVETARNLTEGPKPVDPANVLAAAYRACGVLLPTLALNVIRSGSFRPATSLLLAEEFLRAHEGVVSDVERAEAKEQG